MAISKGESFLRFLIKNKVFAGQTVDAQIIKDDDGRIDSIRITGLHNDEAIRKVFDRYQDKGIIYHCTMDLYSGPNQGDFCFTVYEDEGSYNVTFYVEWSISSLQAIADWFDITIRFQTDETITRVIGE